MEHPLSIQKRLAALLFLVISLVSLSGCTTLGAPFSPVSAPQDNQALIYLYRESSFVGGARKHEVFINDAHITKMVSGGYHPYSVDAGPVAIDIDLNSSAFVFIQGALLDKERALSFNAEPGNIYYAKFEMGFGYEKFVLVGQDIGSKEIIDCQLTPKASAVIK